MVMRLKDSMGGLTKTVYDRETLDELANLLVNMNRHILNRKNHIKKYNKLRRLHSEILGSMQDYLFSGKYDVHKYDDIVCKELEKVLDDFEIGFDFSNDDDMSIFLELFIYPNHPDIVSITDIYLKNNKFRNQEKIKFLECMKNSYVGLFEIIAVDRDNGYVTYQDVFTKKKFKIINIAMSSTMRIDKKIKFYTYNRIITFEDISFATGIHCNFSSETKSLMQFIKNHNYKKCCSFIRCLLLYEIYKKDSNVISNYHHNYG